jgi:hypothetical protein
MLWSPIPVGHRHAEPCVAQASPSVGPSRLLLGEYRGHYDTLENQDPSGHLSDHKPCTTSTTILYKTPCGTSVSRLPFTYKSKRRSPGRGHRWTLLTTRHHSRDIGISLSHLDGTWGNLLHSHHACSPLYKHRWCWLIQVRKHICWTYGREVGTRINNCVI